MNVTVPLSANSGCMAVNDVLSRIGDKWTILVVTVLREGSCRFNEIKRRVGGISQQMLTRTLRALERDGLVHRTVHATTPPQVDYTLTALGESLSSTVIELGRWAQANIDVIHGNRSKYDSSD